MTVFHIFLVIVGLIIIAFSYILSERITKSKTTEAAETGTSLKDYEEIKKEIENIFSELKEEKVQDLEAELSKISNEKIISVNEYSQQILDKIDQNHTEVVFLYDMLNAKEKEMKSLINQIDKSIASGHDFVVTSPISGVSGVNTSDTLHVEDISTNKLSAESNQEDIIASLPEEEKRQAPTQILEMDYEDLEELQGRRIDDFDLDQAGMEVINNNDKILELYREGNTVVEIARELELGQGEVSLVIELFKGEDK